MKNRWSQDIHAQSTAKQEENARKNRWAEEEVARKNTASPAPKNTVPVNNPAQNKPTQNVAPAENPVRKNWMDMAVDSLRNRVANSTIAKEAREWTSRVAGNIQRDESPAERARKQQARIDLAALIDQINTDQEARNEARQKQWEIDTAQIIDQASGQYEGPTLTERGKRTVVDMSDADMFSNDWAPEKTKEIEYERTIANPNYEKLGSVQRDAILDKFEKGNLTADEYQNLIYLAEKYGGIEQLRKEQIQDMSRWDRFTGTASGVLSSAGENLYSGYVLGNLAKGYNLRANQALQEYGPALDETARRWFWGIVNGSDNAETEEAVRTAAAYIGGDAYADQVVSRVRERAKQAMASDGDPASFEYDLLGGIEPKSGTLWENLQGTIEDTGIYEDIRQSKGSAEKHLQQAKELNNIQDLIGSEAASSIMEGVESTIENAADALIAGVLGFTGSGLSYIPFISRSFGGSYASEIQAATAGGKRLSINEEQMAGLKSGFSAGIEYLTERMWGIGGALGKRVTGGGALDDLAQDALAKAITGFAKSETGAEILLWIGEKLLGGATEGLEEIAGNAAEQLLKLAGIMPGEPQDLASWWEDTKRAGAAGFWGGLFGNVTNLVAAPMQQSQIGKQLKAGAITLADGTKLTVDDMVQLANSPGMEGTTLEKTYSSLLDGTPRATDSFSDRELGKLYEAYEETMGRSEEAIDRVEEIAERIGTGKELRRSDVNRITNNPEAARYLKAVAGEDVDLSGDITSRKAAVNDALQALASQDKALYDYNQAITNLGEQDANAAELARQMMETSFSFENERDPLRNQMPGAVAENYFKNSAQQAIVDAAQRAGIDEAGQKALADAYYGPRQEAEAAAQNYLEGEQGKEFDFNANKGSRAQQDVYEAGRDIFLNKSKKEEVNNGRTETESIRVRTGGKRDDGASARRSFEIVEGSAGKAEAGQSGFVSGKNSAKRIRKEALSRESLAALGLKDETDSDREDIREAREYVESKGMKFVAWSGGALWFEGDKYGVRGYYVPGKTKDDMGTVYVRTDHQAVTARQIAKHEAMHGDIQNGKVKIGTARGTEVESGTIRDALIKTMGARAFDNLLNSYVMAYEGTGASVQEIWEELVCDAMGGMNEHLYQGHRAEAERIAPEMQKVKDAADKARTEEGEKKGTSARQSRDITAGMSDNERYQILKSTRIIPAKATSTNNKADVSSLESLENAAKSQAEKVIIPLAKRLGIINKELSTPDLDVTFTFSKNGGLSESLSKQQRYGGSYADFAKALINLDGILESAQLVERHTDKYVGTRRENQELQDVSVLLGAFEDGQNIIPVQMEIKTLRKQGGRLYMTVALTKIFKADVMGSEAVTRDQTLLSASGYSLQDIVSKINTVDADFLKYIPDQMLTEKQIEAKNKAIEKDNGRIASYRESSGVKQKSEGKNSLDRPVQQSISSAGTSLNQVPALHKDSRVEWGDANIDIGAGAYEAATDYLKEKGVKNLKWDPYNQSEAVNRSTLKYLQDGNKADTATSANVLNVIAEKDARLNVVLQAAKSIKPDGKAYFMVYEGDGSGIGKETSKGWQNNLKTREYADEIRTYFNDVQVKGKLIVASDPKANLPKASWEVKPGSAVKFSLDRPVDTTDRLIALHNMSEETVRGMLEIGGLAMPSVAITRADMGHSTYGEISAVYGKSSITPTNRKNVIYSGDAYTPTFPDVGIKINRNAAEDAYDKLSGLLGDDAKQFHFALDSDNLQDQIKRYGSFYKAYKDKDAFKVAFLRDTGRTITVPMKEKNFSNKADNQTLKKIAKALNVKRGETYTSEDTMAHESEIRKIMRDYVVNKYGESIADKMYPADKALSFNEVDSLGYAARNMLWTGQTREVDTNRLEKRLDIAMKTKKIQAEYESWMNEFGKDFVEKKGIRNNQDFFTPYGNRRSFEQLYYPYTLANIVRSMEGQVKQGKTGLLTGSGNIRGAAAKPYASIEDARRDIGRLNKMDYKEAANPAIEAFNNHTLELCQKMVEGKGNRFTAVFDAAEVLTEVIPKYQTADGIYRYLKRENYDDYYNVTPEIAKEIEDVIKEARQLPTSYFEGKMYRAVPITEALAYVVPDNMNKDLKQQLIDSGANVVEYKHGDDADRLAKVNSVEGARFSRDIDSSGKELSEGQKEYFADSKVRDKNGALKVMYQGSNADFTVFDRKKSRGSNLYGRGFYFTDNENAAKAFGKTKPYYLNIVNPLSPGQNVITKQQMRKFLEAVAENDEDYGLENYGEGATVDSVLNSLYGKGDFEMLQDVNATAIGDMVAAVELFNEVNGTDYDGLIMDTETVIFNSEQAKNADNVTPTSNPDVRFSRDIDNYLQERYPVYRTDKENLKLAEEGIRQLSLWDLGLSSGESDSAENKSSSQADTSGIRLLGRGITGELIRKGGVNFTGQKVKNAEDLARLCQILRNPCFETFRYFYVRNGEIVGTDAITTRLPGTTFVSIPGKFGFGNVASKMKRLNADGLYVMHNHPSGNVKASSEDQNVTAVIKYWVEKLTNDIGAPAEFLGHVIIDHNKYTELNAKDIGGGKYSVSDEEKDMPGQQTFDTLLLTPEMDHPDLGKDIGGQAIRAVSYKVAAIGKGIVNGKNVSAVVYGDSKGGVRQIQEISNKVLMNQKEIGKYLRNQAVASGARAVFVYTNDKAVYNEMTEYYKEAILIDVVLDDGNGGISSMRGAGLKKNSNMELGYTLPDNYGDKGYTAPIRRVNEDAEDYGENVTKFSRDLSSAYMAAAESGDTETAAKLVKQAANEAGYTVKAYHIGERGINVFQSGNMAGTIYFADSPIEAKKAARTKREEYAAYLRIVNPVNDKSSPMNWYDAEDNLIVAKWKREGHDAVYVKDEAGVSTAVFYPEQIKSAETFVYDDKGDIIPLSERFNQENRDIRYSRDLTNTELYEANRQLQKDVTELRRQLNTKTEQYKYWKGQTKTTEGRRLRTDDVTKLAREIIKGQESSADVKAIAEKMKALGEYVLNTTDENVYDEARLKAYEIAHEVIENAKILDTRGGEHFYKDFRDNLRNRKIYVAPSVREEVARDGWNEFRKSLFGTVTLTADNTKGDTVDVVYHDLQDAFGEWLFPEYIMTEPDQLNKILEVVETYRPVYENLDSYDMADAVEWTANEILGRIIGEEIRETNPTYADRMEKKLADQKVKAQEAVRKVRQQRDKKVADLKQHYQEVAEARRNRKIDSENRSRLLKIVRRLTNKKLDRATRALLDQYIGDIDIVAKGITGQTVRNLQALRDWYEDWVEEQKAKLGEDFVPDTAIENRIRRLSKKHINDMTQEEVLDLTTVLLNIEHTLRTENQFIDSEERKDTYAAAMEFREDYQNSRAHTDNAFVNALLYGMAGRNKKTGGDGLLTPERAMHRMANYNDNDPAYKLGKELSAGQRKMLDYQMRANALFNEWLNDTKFIDSLAGKKAKWITVKALVNGELKDIRITPAMRMSLYLHAKNEQNLNHIERGGVLIPNEEMYKKGNMNNAYKEEYGTHAVFSRYMIHEIVKGMSEQEKAFADKAYWYFNNMSKDAINDTSEKHKGYAIATVNKYFPIESSRDFLKSDFGMLLNDGSVAGQGFLNERNVKATNPVMLYDMNDVLTKSIAGHSRYYGLALPVQNLNKLLNVILRGQEGSIRNMLLDEHIKYIDKMVRDVQTGAPSEGGLLPALRSNYAGGVLGLNGGVAVKQAASYATAAAVIGYEPLLKALRNPSNKNVDLDMIAKYTPLLWYRRRGFSNTELGDIGSRGGMAAELMSHKALNWIQAIDVWTTTKLWTAAEYYVQDNNKNLVRGTDAFNKEVAKVYNRIIEETQPNYTAMQRPGLLRSDNQITRALNMFKTQPFQNANILIDAYGNMMAKARQNKANPTEESQQALKEARKDFARAVTSQAISAFVFSLMQFVWDMARGKLKKYKDDDDEVTFWSVNKQLALNIASSLGGMVPFGGTILEYAESWIDAISKALGGEAVFDQKFYGLSENSIEAVNDLANTMTTLSTSVIKAFKGDTSAETSARNIVDSLATVVHMATGLPAPNVVKDFQVLALNTGRTIGKVNGDPLFGPGLRAEYNALRVTTDPAKYPSDYYAVLWKAYNKDREVYNEILGKMLDEGFDESKIKNYMEKKMKEQQGVSGVDDLESRWMSPTQQKTYDATLSGVESNPLWNSATDEQKQSLQEQAYNLSIDNKAGQDVREKISTAPEGVDETQYMLFKLAYEMADEDNSGGVSNKELLTVYDKMGGMSDEQKAFYWKTFAGLDQDDIDKKVDGGKSVGLTETEYILYKIALAEADEPNKSGKYGTYTQDEIKNAIRSMTWIDKNKKSYLWTAAGGSEKNNDWR